MEDDDLADLLAAPHLDVSGQDDLVPRLGRSLLGLAESRDGDGEPHAHQEKRESGAAALHRRASYRRSSARPRAVSCVRGTVGR